MVDASIKAAVEDANRLLSMPHGSVKTVPIGCKTVSRSRYEAARREMTSAARKVYDATPMLELWTAQQILAELKRIGVQMPISAVTGCLDGLIHSGVVQEPIRRHFRRADIKEPAAKTAESTFDEPQANTMSKPDLKLAPVKATEKKSPLDILGELSNRAKVQADMLIKLSKDMEDAAIEIQQQIESVEGESGKLKQLQALLKSLA